MRGDQLNRLRQMAEEVISNSLPFEKQTFIEETDRLLEELRVHQIELELQNEELNRTAQALEESRDSYQSLYDFAPVGYATVDREGFIRRANLTLVAMLKTTRQALQGSHLYKYVLSDDRHVFFECWKSILSNGRDLNINIRINVAAQDCFHAHMQIGLSDQSQTGDELYLLTVSNIDELKQAENRIKLSSIAFENTSDAVMITDADANLISVNNAFVNINGYFSEEVIGKNPRILNSGHHKTSFFHSMWNDLFTQGRWSGEIWNRRKNGELYPAWLSITSVLDHQDKVRHFVGVASDISELKETQREIEYLAHHDLLTGLPNRTLLKARFEASAQKAHREKYSLGILFLDLDDFKHVNDSLGHAIGDKLLEQTAKRLSHCIRSMDTLARLGGDEFVVVMEGLHDSTDTVVLSKTIADSMKNSFLIDNQEMSIGISIGISVYPKDGENIDVLLQNADSAMYRAKEMGRNQFCYYSPEFTKKARRRLLMDTELRRGLENDEFVPFYQPQFSLIDNSLVGAEVLVRWQHQGRGLLLPVHFIKMAEETGHMTALSEMILHKACEQWVQWNEQGFMLNRIAVNLHGSQINDRKLTENVERILQQTGCPAQRLELEVTENFVMRDMETSVYSLESLHELGISISIDDFGTGYSSLSQLKNLSIDKLKIDQSFIKDIPAAVNDAEIVRAIIQLGQSLHLVVIAEGVETESQRSFLVSLGCEQMQGFLYSKAVSAEEIFKIMQQQEF